MFWPLENAYDPGASTSYGSAEGKYFVRYDDSDSENLNLATKKWRLLRNVANFSATFENLTSKLRDSEVSAYTSRVYVVIVPKPDDPRILEPCRQEIKGVLYCGSNVVSESDVLLGATVLRSRVHACTKTNED